MSFLKRYLKSRAGGIALFLVCAGLLYASFLLFKLPVKAVRYPLVLCAGIGGVYLFADFLLARRKHRLMTNHAETLPEIRTPDDADYQRIIERLKAESASRETAADARYRDMTDYYTVWAHEIKTPLSSMKLALTDEDSALSRRLQSDLNRVEHYVEMVMTFLRLDEHSSDFLFRACSLDEIVKPSLRKFRLDFIGRKITLVYEPISETVVTDEKWLSFVLDQLIMNALKYTRAGSVRIYSPGPRELVVQDTGVGIAPEDLPRVFEKGYTGLNGRMDKSASGLGLYLCREICKKLNVEISAESKRGEGTAVRLFFRQSDGRKE